MTGRTSRRTASARRLTQVPSYAGARTNPFDAVWSTYNLQTSSVTGIRSAITNAATARVRINLRGHSEVAGVGATPGSNDMVKQLRGLLATSGKPIGGTGMVYLSNNTTPDARYSSIGAGWAAASFPSPFRDATGATGAAYTFVSDVAGTVVDVAYYGNSASFTVKIDAAAPQTVTPNGTASTQVVSFTGLANTTHTVIVTASTASSTYNVAVGVRGTTGIEVTNSGYSSAQVQHWLSTYNSSFFANLWNTAAGAAPPDIVGVQLDASDALNGVTAATFKTDMQTLLTALGTAGAARFLIASTPPGTLDFATVWTPYLSALYDLADQFNIPLVDNTHRFGGSYAAASASGYMGDTVHPNSAGYARTAGSVSRVLTF